MLVVLSATSNCQINIMKLDANIPVDRIEPSKFLIPYIKYIENAPSVSNGVPDINVNLFKEGAENLGLVYNASGVMLNEQTSFIGQGWFLNVGGVVTRIVRGLPDDIKKNGYLNNKDSGKLLVNYAGIDLNQAEFLGEYNGVDYEPDIFYFYTKEFFGKFIINKDGIVTTVPKSNIKITYKQNKDGAIESFEIIPPGGSKYCFDKGEEAVIEHDSDAMRYTSGWRLSRIRSHYNDAITENYSFAKYKQYDTRVFAEYQINYNGQKITNDITYKAGFKNSMIPFYYGNSDVNMFFHYKNEERVRVSGNDIPDKEDEAYCYIDSEGYRINIGAIQELSLEKIRIKMLKQSAVQYHISFYNSSALSGIDIDTRKLDSVMVKKLYSITNSEGLETSVTTTFNYYPYPAIDPNLIHQDIWGYYTYSEDRSLLSESSLYTSVYDVIDKKQPISGGSNRQSIQEFMLSGTLNSIVNHEGTTIEYNFESNRFIHKGVERYGGGLRIANKRVFNRNTPSEFAEEVYRYNFHGTENTSGILVSYPYVGEDIKLSADSYSQFRIGYNYLGITHNGVKPVHYKQVSVSKPGKGTELYSFAKSAAYINGYDNTIETQNNDYLFKNVILHSTGSGLDIGASGVYSSMKPVKYSGHKRGGEKLTETLYRYNSFDDSSVKGLRTRFVITHKNGKGVRGSTIGGNTLPNTDQVGLFTQVSSLNYYTEYSNRNLITQQKQRNYSGDRYIETITDIEYSNNRYRLPLRKVQNRTNGDKLIEQTMFVGSYNIPEYPNGNVNLGDPGDDGDGIVYSKESYSIIRMQLNNNILIPIENIVYLQKPDNARYLISSKLTMFKPLEYEFSMHGPAHNFDPITYTLKDEKIVPYLDFEMRGPFKWTEQRYRQMYIDKSSEMICDTLKMIPARRVTKFDIAGNAIEYTDVSGVISSAKYNPISNQVIYEATNCTYQQLINFEHNDIRSQGKAVVPDGAVIKKYEYKDNRWMVKETDEYINESTYYTYDLLDRVVAVYDNDKNLITYTERNRPGLKPVPVVNSINPVNVSYKRTEERLNWDLSKRFHVMPGCVVTLNGEKITDDKFLFTKLGENEVKYFTYDDGTLIGLHILYINVTSKPFSKTIIGRIADKTLAESEYPIIPDNTLYSFIKDELRSPEILYQVNGGSGNYDVIIYYEYTKHMDPATGGLPQTVGRWIYPGNVEQNIRYYINNFTTGINRYYIWIFDKVTDKGTYSITPDLSTAHKRVFVDFNKGTGELPNPLNP
jgi:hypothetical protein